MKIINKTMDLKDLETEEAKKVIEEIVELNKKYEEKGCKISSWFGECEPTLYSKKINENDKKSLVKQSSPIAYLLSLPAKDAYEVAGRIVNVFDKEFYMSMCEFAFECDDDISYYIKRSIKVAYSRKCDQYMKFYAIKEEVEKKKEECELIEYDVNDGLNYVLNRNQQYKELYKNVFRLCFLPLT